MELDQVIYIALCTAAFAAVFIPLLIRVGIMRQRMVEQEVKMRRQGTYTAWVSQHQQVVRQHRVALTASLASIGGFVLLVVASNFIPFVAELAQVALGIAVVMLPIMYWTNWRLYKELTRGKD
jgi:hypothetical protein